MIVYILIGCLIIYALYKERQALGCKCIPDGTDCDNANGKVVIGTSPQNNDDKQKLKERLFLAVDSHSRFVVWRLALILAFISCMIIWFMAFQRIPSETELLISLFTIGTLIYFSFGFYQFHMWRYVQDNAKRTINKLCSAS